MANVKISQLPIGVPTQTSIFPFVDGGDTYHGAVSALTSNSTVEVTYSELVDKITGETLNTGSFYIITDFKTCYDQPDYDYNKNAITTGIYKDDTEVQPIVVFATSSNTISEIAYQPSYPNDKIQYDWTFSATERTSGVAYGRISERIDEFNNRTDYDHRTILFKRYFYIEIDFNSPYDGTVIVNSISDTEMSVTGTGTNFTSLNVGDYVGFQNTDYKAYEIVSISGDTEMYITGLTIINAGNVEMFPGNVQTTTSYYQNNITTAYTEFYTFDYNHINLNNYVGNFANLYTNDENSFILANNVFKGSTFRNNTFGDGCHNNTFDDDCENNIIGNYFFNNNTDDDFDGNVIGNYFNNNRITSNFQYNRIGENFYNNYLVQNSFYRNNIMNGFENNIISGDDFQNNEIGSGFNNNTLRNGQFYKNDIGNGYNYNKIYFNFYGNLIGNGFNANEIYCEFADNSVGEYYNNNTLGDINDVYSYAYTDNQIGNQFNNNTVFSDFYKNQIGNEFNNNQISGQTTYNFIGGTFQNNTIYNNFNNNKISNEFKGNMMLSSFELNVVDSYIGGNQFSGSTYRNDIGSFTFDNDFLGSLNDNTWKGNFYANTIGPDFDSNSIGENFYGNTIGNGFQYNQIGNNFYNNTIDDNFGYGFTTTQGNKIGNNFFYNTVGEYFYNNSIPDNFRNNQVGDYFQWNIINTEITETNFTLNYGNITGFSYTASGTSASDNLYLDVQICGTTESMGVDATFDIQVSGGTVIGVSGNTEGRLYKVNDVLTILGTQIGGVHNVIVSYSNDGIGKSGLTGNYPELPATGGSGSNANFDVIVVDGLVDEVNIYNVGSGYEVGDTLTIFGSQFGGVDGVDDITITVDSIYTDDIVITVTGVTSGSLFYDHYTKQIFERKGTDKRVSYYDENDILNVESIYEASGYIPVYSQPLTFPLNYTSFEFECNGSYSNNGGFTGNQTNSTQDVVNLFNNSFRSTGYFFDNNDGTIGVYINPSLKRQYCSSGTYTINVFND